MEIDKKDIDEVTLRTILLRIINQINITNLSKKFITKKNTINNFMFVNSYHIDKCIDHLSRSIEWRNENIQLIKNLDEYCSKNMISNNISVLSKIHKNYILYCNLQSDLSIEKIFSHLFSIIEHILNNTDCDQYILIFDCQHIGFDYSFYLPSIMNQIKLLKEHFPERLKNLLLYNSSPIISTIYDGIKLILNDRIKKKVVFIKDNSEIIEYCSQSVLDIIQKNTDSGILKNIQI